MFTVYSENYFVWNTVVKSNAGCKEFEANKVAKLWNVSPAEENKTRKVKKSKRIKNGRGRWKKLH